jgi:para-nitrobenzyl esterase
MRNKINGFPSMRIFLVLAISLISFSQAQKSTATVRVEGGLVSGTQNEKGNVRIFRAIPFAAPPVGNLRWKTPQPALHWKGIRKCVAFSASAIQNKPVPFAMWSKEFMAPLQPLNEDCLYLNVWTSARSAKEKRPVIVWIHGGGFFSGSGSVPMYDGEAMAEKGVVYVTINYRLGIFGFFAHPELTLESGHRASGNYGILDQIAALQWVKKNISAFGGDPSRVTIAGQSAGSFSVNALMASPLAKGLFQRAIAESGAMFSPGPFAQKLEEAEKSGLKLSKSLHANSISELRAIPAGELLKAGSISGLVIDGYVIPNDIYSIFKNGQQNDVPLLTGWNADEGLAFGMLQDAAAFKAAAEKKYGSLAADFLKAYPADNNEQAAQSQKSLSRDQLFGWQNYTWAKMQTTTGKDKVFLYYFTRVPPGKPVYGAFHSSEIGYALHTLDRWDRPWEAWDRKLSDIMSSYWVNFAAQGDPNESGLPVWPAFEKTNFKLMELGDQPVARDIPSQEQFDFMDKYQALLRKN